MKATLKDLSERVGIAKSSISMYLNGDPRTRLSAESRRAIDEAVRELDYRPSLAAAALRRGRSRLIGLVLGEITDEYFSRFAEACLSMIEARGYQLLMTLTSWNAEKERRCLKTLIERQVDGIIFTPALNETALEQDGIISCQVPLIRLDGGKTKFSSVDTRMDEAFEQALKELKLRSGEAAVSCGFFSASTQLAPFRAACVRNGTVMHLLPEVEKELTERSPMFDRILAERPRALFLASSSMTKLLLRKIDRCCPEYRPAIVTVYHFPIDYLDDERVVGVVFGDFYRMAELVVNTLITQIEQREKRSRKEEVQCPFFTREEFTAIRDSLIDTVRKYEQLHQEKVIADEKI